ncbi:MAG: ABC transporter permease, partial [Sinomicrobium sp.]|nr:ABC transporter permease [Sinomicrobium sp.]
MKGSFRIGRNASIPRKVLVVAQFTVSTVLIIGTIIVFQQIRHAQDRPLGYNQDNLVTVYPKAGEIRPHFKLIREELLKTGAVKFITRSSSPLTDNWGSWGNWNWPGKDPEQVVDFPKINVTTEYGKTVGWEFLEGRDFSETMKTDTAAFIINEAAAEFMGFDEPIGKMVQLEDDLYQVIGVVENVITESPFQTVEPVFYALNDSYGDILTAKLNPEMPANAAIKQLQETITKFVPAAVLDFSFVDQEFARKFQKEQKTGKLAAIFATMAILISCLGLLGLSAYMAEKRTKEIGIRKALAASVFQL